MKLRVAGMSEGNAASSNALASRDVDLAESGHRPLDVFGSYTDAVIESGWTPIVDEDVIFSALRTVDGCDLTMVAAIEGDADDRIFVHVRPRTESIDGEPDPRCPQANESN